MKADRPTWRSEGRGGQHRLAQCPQQHPVDYRTNEDDSRLKACTVESEQFFSSLCKFRVVDNDDNNVLFLDDDPMNTCNLYVNTLGSLSNSSVHE